MAGQLATASFDHQHPQAPDNRMQRPNLNARNEISPWIRWEGMQVYVVQEQKTYQLVGGTGNEHWQEIAAGGGASNFVGQFPTFEDLPDSGSPGDYAYVGTGDDFVQYNWDQIAGEWRLNSAETKVSDEDFFLGRVPSEPDRVMFSMRRNSIIYSTGGTQSISPDRMANYVFTGENVTLENVNYSGDGGEEFHITNRTGSNLTILSTGNFASGLTIPAGHMASFKSSDDGWVQSFVNEEATFSDTLDSVNARDNIGSDGKRTISGILDRFTSKEISFKEIDRLPNGQSPADEMVNNLTLFKIGDKYLMNSDLIERPVVNVKLFGAKGDWQNDDTSAIQQAINFSKSIGGSIYLPAGNYKTTDTLNLYTACCLYGDGGKTSIIRPEFGDNKHVISLVNEGTYADTGSELFAFGIEGTASSTTGYGIYFDQVANNRFFDIRIKYMGGGAIWINRSFVNWVSDCYFGLNSRHTTYRTGDWGVVHYPVMAEGNGLLMNNCYISNNPQMNGVVFQGNNGNFRACSIESGLDGIRIGVEGSAAPTTNAVQISGCYFENSHGSDINIVRALNVNVEATFHNNHSTNTQYSLLIGSLRNGKFTSCGFDAKGISLTSTTNSIRNNIEFDSCKNVFFDSENLSGINIKHNDSDLFDSISNFSQNYIPFSDDISKWNIGTNVILNLNEEFVDKSPAYSINSPTTTDFIEYTPLPGDIEGQVCFSCFVKNKTFNNSFIQIRGRRISDNVLETIASTRLAQFGQDTYAWERVWVGATIAHRDVYIRINARTPDFGLTRTQFEIGRLTPSYPILTRGVPVLEKYANVVNGRTISDSVAIKRQDVHIYETHVDNNGFVTYKPTSNQLSDNDAYIRNGRYMSSGVFVDSQNYIMSDKQDINNYGEITISGLGGIVTGDPRVIFFDSNDSVVQVINSASGSERSITLTPPESATKYAINIDQNPNVATPENILLYKNKVMVNLGSSALPFQEYSPDWKFDYQGNGGKILRLREDERGIDFVDNIAPRFEISTETYTFPEVATDRYNVFTGSAGNVTVVNNRFEEGYEIQGEIEGGAKTFVAGAGVTLRYPDGGTNVAPTNSRFFIKFKSPNDAQLTVVPSVIPENTYDTFIPVINGSTANPTASYTEQFGDYALIDRLCHFEMRLNWQSISGGTGNIRIPLPIPRLRNTANGGPAIAVMTGLSTSPPIYACYSGFSNICFRNGAGNEISVSELESVGVIALSGTYIIGE